MSQVLGVTRRVPKEALTYEPFDTLDGQGKPQYGSDLTIEAHVREYGGPFGVGREFIIQNDGSRVAVPLTLWIEGDAPVIPEERGRITLSDGRRFIVVEVKPVSRLHHPRTQPSHVRVRCRKE